MTKIAYDNKSYLNQNPSVPNANKVCDSDMNEIKTVVNGNYDEMVDELYYKADDIIELGVSGGSRITTTGFVSNSTTVLDFTVYTPKRLTNISGISVMNCNVLLRGISGYLNSNSTLTDYASASGYTVSASMVGTNAITIRITKSSAFTNTSNNTPVNVSGYIKLKVS